MYKKINNSDFVRFFWSEKSLKMRQKISDNELKLISSVINFLKFDYFTRTEDIDSLQDWCEVKYPDYQFGALSKQEELYCSYTSGNITKDRSIRSKYLKILNKWEQLDIVKIFNTDYNIEKGESYVIRFYGTYENFYICDGIEALISCIKEKSLFSEKYFTQWLKLTSQTK
jgi:hypothetical protein